MSHSIRPDSKQKRRLLLCLSSVSWLLGCLTSAPAQNNRAPLSPTPSEIEGPFYPAHSGEDQDADLTRIEGRSEPAQGTIITIDGRVRSTEGRPLEHVRLELWHAGAKGNYNHPRDSGAAEADANFQGHAVVTSDKDGKFQIKTIMPGSYSAGRGWMRPPHIHFRISKAGYESLSTQMYFEGHPLNHGDRLLERKSPAERTRMIASRIEAEATAYAYELVLERKTR